MITKMRTLMLIGTLLLLAACSKSNDSSKETAANPEVAKALVSNWITENTNTKAPMGLVLEQRGDKVNATLYELKSANTFVPGEKLAAGNYQPAKKALVLIMGNVPSSLMSPEEWVANGGPYVSIPFEPAATNLTMTAVMKNGPQVSVNLVRYLDK